MKNKHNNFKCGPNWIPDSLFHDTVFNICCVQHDDDYANKRGKVFSDYKFLKCNLKIARAEKKCLWKILNHVQAILLFLLVVVLPFSYMSYYYPSKK